MAKRKPVLKEQTRHQIVGYAFGVGDELGRGLPAGVTYKTLRELRSDPTIALARALLGASVLAGSWSVEAKDDAPEDAVEMIHDTFIPIREQVMESAIFGGVDFGWQGFEKVFDSDGDRVRLVKLKPLLQDLTTILIEQRTGAFAGYKQLDNLSGREIRLPIENCLHIAFRVEGTQWHGTPLLENARRVQERWTDADRGAATYDRKIAGSHFVVYYPPGVSIVDGQERDNSEVALAVLKALESSGSIIVPRHVSQFIDQLNTQATAELVTWKIELLEDRGGRQPTFIDRLKYLDALKVRALLMPERAVLEGQFGTKAEAGEHADMALVNIQLMDRHITRHINWYGVDSVLELNWGPKARGTVWLVAAPLVDEQLAFLRQIYVAILANPQGFMEEFGMLDTDSLKDKLGVPKSATVAQAGEAPMPGLTPEEIAALSHLTWRKGFILSGYDPDQPRVPAGSSEGGQFGPGIGGPTQEGWEKTAPEKHRRAIRYWSGSGYEAIRTYQQTGSYERTSTIEASNQLEEALEKAPKYSGTAHRGISFSTGDQAEKFIGTLANRGTFGEKACASWSASPSVARRFAKPQAGGSVIFKVKSKSGVDIKHLSGAPKEKEVVMPKKAQFRVTRIRRIPNTATFHVNLEEI